VCFWSNFFGEGAMHQRYRKIYRGSAEDNELPPPFSARLTELIAHYFSRNPELWPEFASPGFQRVIDFRRLNLAPEERMRHYPDAHRLLEQLSSSASIPQQPTAPDGKSDELLSFVAALSKDWENPGSVENVVCLPSDPAIYGTMLGAIANANLVHQEYSGMATDLENCVIRQIASLVGYDTATATGIFTQGGTFCNLYGYLMGIRKALPEARLYGMDYTHDYRIINSQGGHYSNTTNLSLLGVNIRKKTIRIKITDTNDMDLDDLESQLRSCFQLKCVVPCIMLTMGTTDTFGVDRVKPVYDLRNRLCEHFDIKVKPHIHIDSAVGWPMTFFLDYDFENNPLNINAITLAGLQKNAALFKELKYADSFTVDFQKWGFVPYTSSLVMIKSREDLLTMENDPENFSYFEKDTQGHTHLQATIECSRGSTGVFGAYAALKYIGKVGYQALIAAGLQNANYFRYRLAQLPNVKVLTTRNQGPSVVFRIYPFTVTNCEDEFAYEYHLKDDDDYRQRFNSNSLWHRKVFLNRGKVGLYTNWVESIAHTTYDEKGRYQYFPGEKAVFFNPLTQRTHIDQFVENIYRGSETAGIV